MQIIRGDTKRYRFKRRTMSGEVITDKANTVYFTVKKGPNCPVLIQKSLDDGITYDENTNYYYINLDSADTENLCAGVYGFDIEITASSFVTTVRIGKLEILSDYTRKGDK